MESHPDTAIIELEVAAKDLRLPFGRMPSSEMRRLPIKHLMLPDTSAEIDCGAGDLARPALVAPGFAMTHFLCYPRRETFSMRIVMTANESVQMRVCKRLLVKVGCKLSEELKAAHRREKHARVAIGSV